MTMLSTARMLTAALLALTALGSACNPTPSASASTALSDEAKVARGKYLVTTTGCHDCHTPWKMGANGPEPDMSRQLSGHPADFALPPPPKLEGPWVMAAAATNTAWSGPWGVSFTANLTSDVETGIGGWTAQNFVETIRNGRHLGRGRPLLPPMPAPVYARMTDADLEAMFAYLRTVPAIKNPVPAPLPPR
jgi:mono/diheme cytochrome c family protein